MTTPKTEKVHPTPNRGVLSTQTAKNGLFLDYLRGTVDPVGFHQISDDETGEVVSFYEPNQEELAHVFGEMVLMGHSAQAGYNQSATLPCGGTVHWHTTDPSRRVLINLGGEALAQLGLYPLTLLEKLKPMGFKVTRMDWAKDDTEGLINMQVISDKIRKGEVVTRFRKWNRIDGGVIGEDDITGETLYIGNRKSESFIRVYDKAAEQAEKGKQQDNPQHHVRVELEIKKRKAQEVQLEILKAHREGGDVARLILGLVYSLVDFKEPGEDTNKSRWVTCDWWLKFLGIGEKVKITVPKPEMTLNRAKRWLDGISPSVSVVNEVDPDFINELLTNGKAKWRPHHKARLKLWQSEYEQAKRPLE